MLPHRRGARRSARKACASTVFPVGAGQDGADDERVVIAVATVGEGPARMIEARELGAEAGRHLAREATGEAHEFNSGRRHVTGLAPRNAIG